MVKDDPASEAVKTEAQKKVAVTPAVSDKLAGATSASVVTQSEVTYTKAEEKVAAVLAENTGLITGRPQFLDWNGLSNGEKQPYLIVARKVLAVA